MFPLLDISELSSQLSNCDFAFTSPWETLPHLRNSTSLMLIFSLMRIWVLHILKRNNQHTTASMMDLIFYACVKTILSTWDPLNSLIPLPSDFHWFSACDNLTSRDKTFWPHTDVARAPHPTPSTPFSYLFNPPHPPPVFVTCVVFLLRFLLPCITFFIYFAHPHLSCSLWFYPHSSLRSCNLPSPAPHSFFCLTYSHHRI